MRLAQGSRTRYQPRISSDDRERGKRRCAVARAPPPRLNGASRSCRSPRPPGRNRPGVDARGIRHDTDLHHQTLQARRCVADRGIEVGLYRFNPFAEGRSAAGPICWGTGADAPPPRSRRRSHSESSTRLRPKPRPRSSSGYTRAVLDRTRAAAFSRRPASAAESDDRERHPAPARPDRQREAPTARGISHISIVSLRAAAGLQRLDRREPATAPRRTACPPERRRRMTHYGMLSGGAARMRWFAH